MQKLLDVTGLKVKFEGHVVLDRVSFEVNEGDTVAIIGPNGAGKTVLFKAILGLTTPSEGRVEWAQGIRVGYVPQKLFIANDIPLTVSEFLQTKGSKRAEIEEALLMVGLSEKKRLKETKLGSLSGGELQRVLIAFALLGNPNILLFDEPTAGIDVAGEETIYALINRLKANSNLTIIFISHELEVVYKYANKVLCLNKEKICFGPPKEVVDKESLTKLYGEDVHFYKHDHAR